MCVLTHTKDGSYFDMWQFGVFKWSHLTLTGGSLANLKLQTALKTAEHGHFSFLSIKVLQPG